MIAEGYVANGAKVYITGREAKACHEAAATLNSLPSASTSGGSAVSVPSDLQKLSECEALVAKLKEAEGSRGGLHVLVNNAGAAWGASVDEYPDHAWGKLLTLNLQRVFTLTQMCLPLLEQAARDGDPARIINIGSIDGIRPPVVNNYAYSASKAGLHQLSRHLARDLGKRNITSNVLACGPFRTKMMKGTLDAMEETIVNEVPLHRIGKPEDVAGACLFLSSQAG